jgi:hypothetical protein
MPYSILLIATALLVAFCAPARSQGVEQKIDTQPSSITKEDAVSDVAPDTLGLDPRVMGLGRAPVTAIEGTRSVASLDVLVVIYTTGLSPVQVEQAKEGFAFAREFYWRNSLARLNLNMSFMEIPTVAPDLAAVTMVPIEEDLRPRGVTDNQYSAIYVTAADHLVGIGLQGCFGGFVLFGQTAGAYCPIFGLFYNILPDPAWFFTHEFQHALDGVIAGGSGLPEFIFGHPYEGASYCENRALFPAGIDFGTHFDWEAGTLRLFTHYAELQEPWNRPIIVTDSDADGLPDEDANVAMDEARLGTDPFDPDTDNDGLNDLAEFSAAVFRGTDPLDRDTDDDGRRDGRDPLPLYVASPTLRAAKAPVAIDGLISEESWQLLTKGVRQRFLPGHSGLDAALYATWDSNALYLAIETSELPAFVDIQVDGSGTNGPWLGADFFYLRADLLNEVLLTKQYSSDRALEIVPEEWGPPDIPSRAIPDSQVAVGQDGTLWTVEIAIPRQIGFGFGQDIRAEGVPSKTGLTLVPGHVVGLNVRLNNVGRIADPNADNLVLVGEWASLTELLEFLDLTLGKRKRTVEEPLPSVCDSAIGQADLNE